MPEARKSLYVESTIPSYATAWESRDPVIAGHQAATKLFWERERWKYDLCISQDVLDECSDGDPEAAWKRLEWLEGIRILPDSEEKDVLTVMYQNLLKIPERAVTDCAHLATCVVWRIDYLLTWNCTHLGLASYIKAREYNDRNGLWTPALVTPDSIYGFRMEEL